jgi:hypothetical protein
MEDKPHDWQFDRKEFWEGLTSRFQLHGADNIGDTSIVSSFSASEVDAFYSYFALLDECLQQVPPRSQPDNPASKRRNFVETLRAIHRRCLRGRLRPARTSVRQFQ